MNNFRGLVVGGAILSLAAGAFVTAPQTTLAQTEPRAKGEARSKGEFRQRHGMHRFGGQAPLISIALKHREQLNLSSDQVASLEKIRTHYQEQAATIQQQLRPIESELRQLLRDTPANLVDAKVKIQQAEKHRAELRYLRIEALENGRSVLTAQQQDQLRELVRSAHRGMRKQQGQTGQQS